MFTLILKYHATNQEILFSTREHADAALAALKPHLGYRYGKNEELTHTIESPYGPSVVVCDKIESASVLDLAAHNIAAIEAMRMRDDASIDYEARKAKAIKDAEAA